MQNRTLQRFDFGTLRDFRGPLQLIPEAKPEPVDEAPPPPPPPSFNEDELQQARIEAKKLGYNEGFMAGMGQAAAEADVQSQHAEKAFIALEEQIATLSATYTAMLQEQALSVSELALVIAKKVAEEALKAAHVDVIAGLVTKTLPMLYSRPRVVIELHPETLPKAENRLREGLLREGFEGEVLFRGNSALAPHDARLDWGTGMAERSTATMWKDIESLLARVPFTVTVQESPAQVTKETEE